MNSEAAKLGKLDGVGKYFSMLSLSIHKAINTYKFINLG